MRQFLLLFCTLLAFAAAANPPALDFTVTTSDGQVKKLYQDYVNQDKLLVIEAFFTTCPPCATHAPLVKNLYASMQAAHPGKVEFMLLSTLTTDTNVKVAQYKTAKGLTMPGVGKDGGSLTALQPYTSGQYGTFLGTPTFIIIVPNTGEVIFDIRGNSASETISMLEAKIESYFPKICAMTNAFGSPLDSITVSAHRPGFDTTLLVTGQYSLSGIPSLQSPGTVLKPHKAGPPSPGLTTYDLVLISKNILGIEPFQCTYQSIAADLNRNGSVTSFDIVTARKVILGIDTMPCGTWRFMPDSAVVSNANCQTFTGVPLGDVNAGPCFDSLSGSVDGRSAPDLLFYKDRSLKAGEAVQIPMFLNQTDGVNGFQFNFDINPSLLRIEAVESDVLEAFNAENYSLRENGIACSWSQAVAVNVGGENPLIRLSVRALQDVKLSEAFHLNETGLQPELYTEDGKLRRLECYAQSPEALISPNPAKDHILVQTEAGSVQLFDLYGHLMLEKENSAGFQSVEIGLNGLPSGLYLVKIGDTETRLLVVQ